MNNYIKEIVIILVVIITLIPISYKGIELPIN